ncbi:MAG: DUF1425 domain-containing protein [Phycisphaeraceae bacterium]
MNLITPLAAVTLALSLLTAAGCKSDPGVKSGWVAGEDTSQVICSDPDLRSDLRTGRYVVTPGSADTPLQVTVPVRSTDDDPVAIQYRYTFFKPNGVPINHEAAWQTAVLEPDVQEFLSGTAVDYFASDWNLEIRPDRSR